MTRPMPIRHDDIGSNVIGGPGLVRPGSMHLERLENANP